MQCSNQRCKKVLDFSKDVVSLDVVLIDTPTGNKFPQTGRMYCDRECFEDVISHINIGVPVFQKVEIISKRQVSKTPLKYEIVCRQKFIPAIK